jgi:hypothetical protein
LHHSTHELVPMNNDIQQDHHKLNPNHLSICDKLASIIDSELTEAESKVWHAHPVWFLDGNPIVGYSIQKPGVRLMFWSGADFEEELLVVRAGKFKDASVFYNSLEEIDEESVRRCLKKSRTIQWDYKNIVKRKGRLERIKN